MQRDQKGLYQKAMSGEIQNLPGVQQLYEEPEAPAIVVDTGEDGPKVCLEKMVKRLRDFKYIPNIAA
jgi:adenylylsulfate kinase-like enzyme